MARIIEPKTYEGWSSLLADISEKHKADGDKSVLLPCFKKYDIDLEKDEKTMNKANDFNDAAHIQTEQSEALNKDRDSLFKTQFLIFRKIVQFLKGLNFDNPRNLSEWGLKIDNTSKIVYPAEFLLKVKLINTFLAHHEKLGADSPIIPYLDENQIDLKNLAENIQTASVKNSEAIKLSAKSEENTAERDRVFEPVKQNIQLIGSYLKRLYDANPQKLGDWGFQIDSSPQTPQERTAIIDKNSAKTIKGIKLGSNITNTGKVELLLYAGVSIKKEGVKLASDDSFTVTRNYGTTTVQNKDKVQAGQVKYVTTHHGS